VVDEEAMDVPGAVDATAVQLAVEIVSPSNPENDYEGKLRDHPIMGIPHYLIIDPRDGTAHHHWKIATESGHASYTAHVPYVFGDKITVGDWVIDSGELRRYPEPK
jgi:prolyl-tRNA synthetase